MVHPVYTVAALITTVGVTLAEILIPLITARAVDTATGQAEPTHLWHTLATSTGWTPLATVVAVLAAIALIRYAFQFGRRYYAGQMSLWTQHELRLRILGSLQKLDGPSQDSIRTGQVVSRSISDLNMVQGLLAMFPLALGSALKFLITLIVMAMLSWQMTIAALIITPVLVAIGLASKKLIFASTWTAQQQTAEIATHVEQTVTGVRVVKGFAQEEREIDELDALGRTLYSLQMRVARQRAKLLPALSELPNVALVINVGVGGVLAMNGHITIGVFLAFSTYLSSLTTICRFISNMVINIQMARSSVSRVFDVIAMEPEQEPDNPQPIPDAPLGIECKNVAYQGVLNGFDLSVAPGSTTVLVGPPGAGKSMFVQLISHFYPVDSGSISLTSAPAGSPAPAGGRTHANDHPRTDGPRQTDEPSPAGNPTAEHINIDDIDPTELRATIATVFDEPFLYSRSIRDNIALGNPTATDEEIEQAAKDACAHEFITELPDGYDTVTGERGLTLSGGQRQRIALARVLLSPARILVLDDATSAIDATTEARIIRSLKARHGELTVIIIAHRHSTLGLADTIVVVDGGRNIASGTFDELQKTSPDFLRIMSLPTVKDGVSVPFDAGETPSEDLLWPGIPPHDLESSRAAALEPASQTGEASSHASATANSSMGAGLGGGGSAMASAPATAEIRAMVEALPPATEQPGLDPSEFRNDTSAFSLTKLLSRVKWLIVAIIIFLITSVAADIIFPTLVRFAIDHGVARHSVSTLFTAAGVGLAIVALSWAASAANEIVTSRAGERLLYALRLRSFAHVQHLGLDYFEATQSGRIMTRMTTDIDSLSKFLQTGMAQAIVSATTLIGVATMLLVTAPRLALVALLAVPLVVVATVIFRRISSRLYREARSQISTVNADFQEIVGGIRTSQVFGNQADDLARFTADAERYRKLRMRAQTAVSIYFPGINAISELAKAAIVGVGATMVIEGRLSVGILVAFLIYMDQLFSPIQQLSQVFDQYQQAEVGLRRIGELIRTTSSVPDTGSLTEVPSGDLRFDDVHFSYGRSGGDSSSEPGSSQSVSNGKPEVEHGRHTSLHRQNQGSDNTRRAVEAQTPPKAKDVLNGIDLRIAEGSTVAIVGATGAGKSTIVKLIARFYDVTGGAVRTDETDIRELSLNSWRRSIGLVPQEAHLFAGTIASNIAYGQPSATASEVMAAARRIGALSAIAAIPGGFLAPIGEGGRGLSSGQRQIIALARAELVSPELMLLDEATATLDPATEKTILAASRELTRGRTSVIVAHRLATAAQADEIIVMDKGRVVEKGPHAQLVGAGGPYSTLWANSGGKTDDTDVETR